MIVVSLPAIAFVLSLSQGCSFLWRRKGITVHRQAQHERDWDQASSFTSSAPRRIWSSSIDLKSAVKLPSPKPSSFLRWMNSKKTGPITVWPKIWSSSRSEEHTSELQSLMRTSYAVFCLKKKKNKMTKNKA